MNLLFLIVFGVVVGSLLFLIEPQKNKKVFATNVLLGSIGAVVGGIYAQLFLGADYSRLGLYAYIVIIFSVVLLWYIGKIIRQVK